MGGVYKVLAPIVYAFLNGIIKTRIGKAAEDCARIAQTLPDLVFGEVINAQETATSGPDKHQAVADKIIGIIKQKDGIELPEWALEFLSKYLDDLIRTTVAELKKHGLFPS